jgi:hypothetical protein
MNRRVCSLKTLSVGAAVLLSLASQAQAQTAAEKISRLEARVAQLEKRLAAVESLFGMGQVQKKTVPLPPGAVEAAIAQAECQGCKDYKVIRAIVLAVSSADRANGATEKFCLQVGYVYRTNLLGNPTQWRDGSKTYWVRNFGGIWQTQDIFSCELP